MRCALIARLADASGHSGMIGGQIIDMLADKLDRQVIRHKERLQVGHHVPGIKRAPQD